MANFLKDKITYEKIFFITKNKFNLIININYLLQSFFFKFSINFIKRITIFLNIFFLNIQKII